MTRAALYDRTGGPEVLYVGEVDDPAPGPGQVTVRVRAAGINPYDSKVRRGEFGQDGPFPKRVGSDLAGTVEAVGEEAAYRDGTPATVGDEVLGSGSGTVAELSLAKATNLVRRPAGLSVEVAGSLHVPGMAALACIGAVPAGTDDTLLVGAATGGVGLLVCQLAVAAGAIVLGTGSPRNHDFIASLGAIPITYGDGLAARAESHGPVTAVIDCHGREAIDAGVDLGVPPDRMTGTAAFDAIDELGLPSLDKTARTAENLAGLAVRIAAGKLVLPIAATFSLDEVTAAFAALESPHPPGKIVVLP